MSLAQLHLQHTCQIPVVKWRIKSSSLHIRQRCLTEQTRWCHSRPGRCHVRAQQQQQDNKHATQHPSTDASSIQGSGSDRKLILILGGTGRVGASTAAALLDSSTNADILLASRNEASYQRALKSRPELKACRFLAVDRNDPAALRAAFKGVDLVLHTAGPFQRKGDCYVLEAALATGTAYVDICDDSDYAARAKEYHEQAKAAGVPAITSAGIYPGVSNVMAAHMVSTARREYDSDGRWVGQQSSNGSESVEPKSVRYYYYTAGTGGVGPTIMETSFLLAGTPVVAYVDGKKVQAKPITQPRVVDFGKGLGRKSVWLYHLPEVESTHKYMRVPNVSARFGTDPNFWNWAMVATARLAPKRLLEDRAKIRAFAKATSGVITAIDPIVGEKVGMRIDVALVDGSTAVGVFIHKRLSDSVGVCTAAFARAMLSGNCQPGVWFPEQPEAIPDRMALLTESSKGCIRFDVNKSPFQVESDAKQLGMGIYLDI